MSGQSSAVQDDFLAAHIAKFIGDVDGRSYGPPKSLDASKNPYGSRRGRIPDYEVRATDRTCILLRYFGGQV